MTFPIAPGPDEVPLTDGLVWQPWHAWRSGFTKWIDGALKRPADSFSRPLDVATADGPTVDGVRQLAAEVAWHQESVLATRIHGIHVLLIPCTGLTLELIQDAFLRARNDGLLPDLRHPLPED